MVSRVAGEPVRYRGGTPQTRVAPQPAPRGSYESQGCEERGTTMGGAADGHPTQTKGKMFIK